MDVSNKYAKWFLISDTNVQIVRLLDLVKLFLPVLPEIELPLEKVSLDEKIIYTVIGGLVFLFSQLPLYGLVGDANLRIKDPFFFQRSIFAMEKGTLLELGLLPIITSAFLWQLAAGTRRLKVNLALRSERELFQAGQKLTSFVLSIIYALGFVFSGYYSGVVRGQSELDSATPYGSLFMIFVQIVLTSFIISLLAEMFDKGYGFGSGLLCFLALLAATNFVKDFIGLEIIQLPNSNKLDSFGSFVSLVRSVKFDLSKLHSSVWNSFTRTQLPNLTQFYISLVTILIVIGLQNFRIEIPIRSTKVRGMNNVFPIRLLYTGALPIVFAYTVIANIQLLGFFSSSILKNYYPQVSKWVGQWYVNSSSFNLVATSGVLYYLSPPTSLLCALFSPVRTIIYSSLVFILSGWFANKWSMISGSSPSDISKQFKEQGISITGKRDVSIVKEFSRIIPVAAVSGAFSLAVLAVAGDLLGGLGKGVSTIIGLISAFTILEEFMIEFQQSGGSSQFANAF